MHAVVKALTQGTLSPTEHSTVYLNMIQCIVQTLGVKLATEIQKILEVVHDLVQADLPAATLLPMLVVHVAGNSLHQCKQH